jgi:hypothetical protein
MCRGFDHEAVALAAHGLDGTTRVQGGEMDADAAHVEAPPSSVIDRFHRIWGFVDRLMTEHWARLPLVNLTEMHARWTRYAAFDARVRQTHTAELLLAARRSNYAHYSSAALHRLADRFVGLMELFCGPHLHNVIVRRRQLIHGFAFLAWRRGLPVRFETAYRFMDLRVESDRADMQNFLLRPSTPQEAVRRALAFTGTSSASSLQLEQAVARALAPARRRYAAAELLGAAAELRSAKRMRVAPAPRVPTNLYVLLVRHVEQCGPCPTIAHAVRLLARGDAPSSTPIQ